MNKIAETIIEAVQALIGNVWKMLAKNNFDFPGKEAE